MSAHQSPFAASDLVTRLRAVDYSAPHDELCRDAADEIERLRADLRSTVEKAAAQSLEHLTAANAVIEQERTRADRAEAERDALRSAGDCMARDLAEALRVQRELADERDALRDTLHQLRDMAYRSADKTLADRIIACVDAALREGK